LDSSAWSGARSERLLRATPSLKLMATCLLDLYFMNSINSRAAQSGICAVPIVSGCCQA
jgi:hypothetical protein